MNKILTDLKLHFEAQLSSILTVRQYRLQEAMHYSATNGGKRIRPVLCYLVGETLGATKDKLDTAALALELVHCYSLVHDDLPAMDDDDLRRGKPTCHIAYDEATAVLVGDALQSLAFEVISQTKTLEAKQVIRLIEILSTAIGDKGMCLGQALDMEAEQSNTPSLEQLQLIHENKTGKLILASTQMAAIAAGFDNDEKYLAATELGRQLGLAFQIKDDLLDVTSTTETLGKPQGSDEKNDKLTYCRFYSVTELNSMLDQMNHECLDLASKLSNDSSELKEIINYIFHRSN